MPVSNVELVYIPKNGKPVRAMLDYLPGMTVSSAMMQSALMSMYPEIAQLSVGIFAQVVFKDTLVKPGDRIEFYRPLLRDPKDRRRQRARLRT